jgi:site-specific DNA recombinase
MRTDEGGYRRHHIQALTQRVDVGEAEVRITGSKLTLLQTLVASGAVVKSATNDVRSFVPEVARLPGYVSNFVPRAKS